MKRVSRFEGPPKLLNAIGDWLDTLIDLGEKDWKKVEKKFRVDLQALEGWKYLSHLENLPPKDGDRPLDAVLTRWKNYPLRVVVKNVQKIRRLDLPAATWSRAGNIMTLYSLWRPNLDSLYNSATHELLHMSQYLMGQVLLESGIDAKPGRPTKKDLHGPQQNKGPGNVRHQTHNLDPLEFYPNIHTEFAIITNRIDDSLDEGSDVDPREVMLALSWYMGASRLMPEGVRTQQAPFYVFRDLFSQSAFRTLETYDRGLWKKAVSEMYKKMKGYLESQATAQRVARKWAQLLPIK